MGKFVLILFMMLSFGSFSQLKDTLEAKKFWADNIANIVSSNKDKVLAQTHFPLKVGDKKFTREQFKLVMDKYLNQDLRNELKTKDIQSIDAWQMMDDEGQTYMIVCDEGIEPQYSAAVLCFLQYNGKWLLNQIDYQKEE